MAACEDIESDNRCRRIWQSRPFFNRLRRPKGDESSRAVSISSRQLPIRPDTLSLHKSCESPQRGATPSQVSSPCEVLPHSTLRRNDSDEGSSERARSG